MKNFIKILTVAFILTISVCFSNSKAYAFAPNDGEVIKHTSVGEQLKAIDSIEGWWLVAESGKLGWVEAGPTSYWDSNHSTFPIYLRANKQLPIYEGGSPYTYTYGEKINVYSSVPGWWKVITPNNKVAWLNAGPTKYDGSGNLICTASSLKAYFSTTTEINKGKEVVEYAKNFLGVPYVYGGSTPNGFDCSGLTQYVYNHFGVDITRTTYTQVNQGTYVAKENLLPGDLVFFDLGPAGPEHVGMYVGNGQYIHAPQPGDVVKISQFSDWDKYYTARRILN